MKIKPKLVIGLGNPGKEYEKTYHNAGFLFIDYLINKSPAKIKNQSASWRTKIKNFEFIKTDNYIFIKPLTFMNDAGKSVMSAMKYFKIKPEELLIIHDDADLLLGGYKLSSNQGSAGHKGIESIIKNLGTKNFYRLRIGIRNPDNKTKALNLVLKRIKKQELLVLNQTFEEIIDNNLLEL